MFLYFDSISPTDVVTFLWGYKKARELARRMDLYRGEFFLEHPAFPEGSTAIANPE